VHNIGRIGVSRAGVEYRSVNPAAAVVEATAETWRMGVGTLKALFEMVIGSRGTAELGGPLRIAYMAGETMKSGLPDFFLLMAFLSANLGLVNLLPIPMLDGGHLLMYGIEAARGRPLSERKQEFAFRFGLIMVLSLMVFVFWNDLTFFK